ncbi:AAA family ATPase [Streptomyces sp. NPDC000983]|uniref:AAA family ATPase n=1 Tax=Streptomyces sp. NPDC000983 TaxID=3154373 RepID=UPI00332F907C
MARDLRAPTGPPTVSGFAGREREVSELRALLAVDDEQPPPLVLHGPAGVGKSALAAVATRDLGLPVHWITFDDTVDVEGTLLRLLAECGAPRVPIVRAAVLNDRKFIRELRNQCAQYAVDRVLVLDNVGPSNAEKLRTALRGCPRLRVVATTREASFWPEKARLREVRPLESVDALVVSATVAQTAKAEPLTELTLAAAGLPYLARIVGALVKEGLNEVPEGVDGPDALIDLALNRCTLDEYRALEVLTRRESGAPFSLRAAVHMFRLLPDLRLGEEMLGRLVSRQLVQPWKGEHEFVLPTRLISVVRARARRMPHASPSARTNYAQLTLHRASCMLDGERRPTGIISMPFEPLSPIEVVDEVDEFMTLASRESVAVSEPLATVLAVLGDAHRLVALHRKWSTPPINHELASMARELGLPDHARILLKDDESARAVHERAAIEYQSGNLRAALSTLDTRPPDTDGPHVAWYALIRGAVLCDQGNAYDADRLLSFAAQQLDRFKCRRGHGWALFHLARTYLLRGWAAQAEDMLDVAEQELRSIGDQRGLNWIATERIRLPGGLRTDPDGRATLAAHRKADDLRGVGWTELYLALRYAVVGTMGAAHSTLGQADRSFVTCQDALGSAWARHRLALFGPTDSEGDMGQWELIHEQFQETGCTVGTAWTLLERASRTTPGEPARRLQAMAASEFRAVSNPRGLAWAEAVRAVLVEPGTGPDRATLASTLPPELPDREQLIQQIAMFCDAGGPLNGHPIPFHARDIPVTVSAGSDLMGDPGVGPRCRVRITLLDESPTTGTTARLLLRVSPEPGHPWAAGGAAAPWLTATALPLTRATLEPASAHLVPSEQEAHGAEFDFTPHRTGTHRLRFTIALARTGTVLQQVETELDILDHDRPGDHAAPHAIIPRGR